MSYQSQYDQQTGESYSDQKTSENRTKSDQKASEDQTKSDQKAS